MILWRHTSGEYTQETENRLHNSVAGARPPVMAAPYRTLELQMNIMNTTQRITVNYIHRFLCTVSTGSAQNGPKPLTTIITCTQVYLNCILVRKTIS